MYVADAVLIIVNVYESIEEAFPDPGADPTAFQVDGVSVTPKWQGGTAPTSGNASSIDSYTYVIIKTGSATFTVLASVTKFA